ncbi:MAG: TonB-dependent receptor [Candidatus Aminicenantes bacterium]|nr:TonB-dependent receptor [Candidatus Aminicenantes bacterium]
MIKFRNLLFCVLGIILITSSLFAQIPTKGSIFGSIIDEEGNALPGVSIEATSPKHMGTATAVTDVNGKYRMVSLTPGVYTIKYTLEGFKPYTRGDIIVRINATVSVDIVMAIGTIEEEITVIGESPIIDVKSTTKGMTLSKEMFQLLPKGRNFDTLVTAVPGVNNESWLGGVSVDGASAAENMYYVDGTDITRVDTGRGNQNVAFEFIEEVQIIASGYEAEYGGALGGVVSVITRQGGNEFHGELIGYYSGSALTGKERDSLRYDPLQFNVTEYVNYQEMYGKDPTHRYEVGFSLGGYILKDRLWFFGSFLPVISTHDRYVEFLSPAGATGDYSTKTTYWNFQAKLTAQPFSFMRVGASFVNNFSKWRGDLPDRDGTENYGDPNWGIYGYDDPNWTASFFADLTLGANFMANIRGGKFYYDHTNQQVTAGTFGEPRWYHGSNYTDYFDGTSLEVPSAYQVPHGWQNRARIYEYKKFIKYKQHIGADFTYFMSAGGEHALKFGIQWVRQGEDADRTLDSNYPDVYFYWGRDCIVGTTNHGQGTYGYYEVRGSEESGPFGDFFDIHNDRWALYFQDSWTIADRVTLNLGLRAESEYIPPFCEAKDLPAGLAEDFKAMEFGLGDKLAPRIGFIYDVFGDTSLKIFGSFGHYYDVIKTYMPAHSYAGFKWKSAYHKLDTYEWIGIGLNNYFPGETMAIIDWRTPSFDSTDPDMKPVSQQEISFGVEKMLMENLSATVRVVQKHLRYTIEDVGVITPEGEKYFECNPGYGYSLHIGNGTGKFDPKYPETPRAKREYWAVNFSVDKRLSNNWLAGFSYTWSRLTGNYSGLGSSDEYGRTSPYVERSFDNWAMAVTLDPSVYLDGPLVTDRTHFFKFYGAYTFPFGLTIGSVINAMSGTPITETWSVLGTYWYPFNYGYTREADGSLKKSRTPFLWFSNIYAEYNLKLGKYRLNLNVNVDNLFDIATSRRLYNYRTLTGLAVSEDLVLSKNWDLDTPDINYTQHPRWMMEQDFYPPISVRLGIKFIF